MHCPRRVFLLHPHSLTRVRVLDRSEWIGVAGPGEARQRHRSFSLLRSGRGSCQILPVTSKVGISELRLLLAFGDEWDGMQRVRFETRAYSSRHGTPFTRTYGVILDQQTTPALLCPTHVSFTLALHSLISFSGDITTTSRGFFPIFRALSFHRCDQRRTSKRPCDVNTLLSCSVGSFLS
jgi:hypothetical protein